MQTKKVILIILVALSSLWTYNCNAYDDLYGNGKNKNDKNKKDECTGSALLYASCAQANPSTAMTTCYQEYVLAAAYCGGGGAYGGGGGGGY
ncbi:hypothetical protein EHQ53_01800 [Leptospira langatensis]|uniref:Lipoprotein n=1 Tax=Leptospira langatensis TaxID=2484983 RepID=A0A5F1ZXJ0_9LEPT|nr:hypothetical protein [Leptospira langatensis]TGJ98480.1 hypothetical protein EHO57_17940 [Leptospira langatensis]TGL43394.1 hypothetical protein EHQ53_01800 [Leptospira langatensis]